MEKRIPFEMKLPSDLLLLAREFHIAGHELYVVGGAVRDAVMGLPCDDFDVATDARPEKVISFLSKKGWSLNETGKSFGVVRASLNGGEEYEIATFRTDVGEGRRPDSVEFTTIEEDVKRRDLTINALFFDIRKEELVDLVGGLQDINDQVIRCVGNPFDRFREDKLRIFRALRFSARLGWKISLDTSTAMLEQDVSELSFERIHDEFEKSMRTAKDTMMYLKELSYHGLLGKMFPGMIVQGRAIIAASIPEFIALAFEENHNVPFIRKRLNELKYPDSEIAKGCFLIAYANMVAETAYKTKKLAVACHIEEKIINEFYESRFLYDFKVKGERFKEFKRLHAAFQRYVPSVSGDDLIAEGFSGKELGVELQRRELVEFNRLLQEI